MIIGVGASIRDSVTGAKGIGNNRHSSINDEKVRDMRVELITTDSLNRYGSNKSNGDIKPKKYASMSSIQCNAAMYLPTKVQAKVLVPNNKHGASLPSAFLGFSLPGSLL